MSVLFFYTILNFIRGLFGKPIFYDVFVQGRSIVVIGPYYSLQAFLKTVCVCQFENGSLPANVVLKPTVVDDPDKNCMVVLFNLPENMPRAFHYLIYRGNNKLFSADHIDVKNLQGTSAYKFKLTITTLFKYEVDFLEEWIEYHQRVGVEHFYIYENNTIADKRIAEILKPYIDKGLVTHILWPYPYEFYNYKLRMLWPNDAFSYTQLPQINHALYKFAHETEWLLSCDVDEYFYSPKVIGGKLTGAIDAITAENNVSSIRIQGFWFGGTTEEMAQLEEKKVGVLRTFIRSEREPTSACKCILDTASVHMSSVHNSLLSDKGEITVGTDIIRFNHYRALGWKKRPDEHFAREVENLDILKS